MCTYTLVPAAPTVVSYWPVYYRENSTFEYLKAIEVKFKSLVGCTLCI